MKFYIGIGVVILAVVGLAVDYFLRRPATATRSPDHTKRPDKMELLVRIADLTIEVAAAIPNPDDTIEHLNAVYVAVVKAK